MTKRIVFIVAFVLAASVQAQVQAPTARGRQPDADRFKKRVAKPPVRRPTSPRRTRPTSRPARRPSKKFSQQQQLFSQADALARKVHASGPWSKHSAFITQGIESVWAQGNMNTDTDQFTKKLLIDVSRQPPWDFNGRLKAATDLIRGRYGLNDDQVKKLQQLAIRNAFAFFLKNAKDVIPIAQEAIDTRLANKPFTPEQMQRWSKVVRPIAEKWFDDAGREIHRFGRQSLTPEQYAKVKEDLVVIDKRAKFATDFMKRKWETGQWKPEMLGLEKDPVHVAMQARLAEGDRQGKLAGAEKAAAKTPEPPPDRTQSTPAARPPGPMRLGEAPPSGRFQTRQETSRLPDETKWVAYVRQFCERYGLDKAQRAAADAILKDLQEQAQSFRSSRTERIKRLETLARQADSREERNDARAELRDILQPIEDLFEELKGRLEGIPTAGQLRQVG